MGATIQLRARDGHHLSGYLASPASSRPRGGVVVVQEIFGVNAVIRGVCDLLAAEDYFALAPAIFDRQLPNVELSYDQPSIARGRELMHGLDRTAALWDLAAAIEELEPHGSVGIVGFCLGGTLAWLAGARLPVRAAIGYYATDLAALCEESPRCPAMLHMAERDHIIPGAKIDFIRAKQPEADVYAYPATHGFACEARPEAYDRESAELAWSRTLELLSRALRIRSADHAGHRGR